MSVEFGPYLQMRSLAEQMAARYQMDVNLDLGPYLAHYMDEVEVNIAADRFDHVGFMEKIRAPLQMTMEATTDPRRRDFLQALVEALHERIGRYPATAST